MLEIRSNCELCDCDLPAAAGNAMVCSYECTYCADCAHDVLEYICPKCRGQPRPIRPARTWRDELGLLSHPASIKRVHTKYINAEIATHVARIRKIASEER